MPFLFCVNQRKKICGIRGKKAPAEGADQVPKISPSFFPSMAGACRQVEANSPYGTQASGTVGENTNSGDNFHLNGNSGQRGRSCWPGAKALKRAPCKRDPAFAYFAYFLIANKTLIEIQNIASINRQAMRTTTFLILMASYFPVASIVAHAQCRTLSTGAGEPIFNSMVLSGSKLFGATNAGLFVSSNYGETWNEVGIPTLRNTDVRQLAADGTQIYAATYGRGLYKSTDQGNTWNRVNLGNNVLYFTAITVSGSTIITSAGQDGTFVSTNDGSNWSRINAPAPYNLMPTMVHSASEMRDAYNAAVSHSDACLLFSLGVIENAENYMQDVKAGDMLYQSYQWAVQQNRANLLLEIAKYENSAKIMQERAGNILSAAHTIAIRQKDARLLFEIARFENKVQISDLKAGDALQSAYQFGTEQNDQRLLYDLARYENQNDIMSNVNAANVLYNAILAAIAYKDFATLYLIADYEEEVNLLSNISSEEIRRRARIIQWGG